MNATRGYRVGVVGATSLLGKDLAEELPESGLARSHVVLLDDEDAAGQLTTVGEDAAVVESIGAGSLDGLDFAMFAGSVETTAKYWKAARRAGAGIVDLTYALEGEAGVLIRAPALQRELGTAARAAGEPDLQTVAVVVAHPAAVMLGLVGARLGQAFAVETMAATVLQPASEEGRAGMDELHQQTVSLLSFQPLPKEQFDAQVAFNLLPAFGEGAKARSTVEVRERVERHYRAIGGGTLPTLALQVAHAPVFHGLVASVYVQVAEAVTAEQVRAVLAGGYVQVASEAGDDEPPTNVQTAGQRQVSVQVRGLGAREAARGFWVWTAADNLRLHATNAIACALELGLLRPHGKVQ